MYIERYQSVLSDIASVCRVYLKTSLYLLSILCTVHGRSLFLLYYKRHQSVLFTTSSVRVVLEKSPAAWHYHSSKSLNSIRQYKYSSNGFIGLGCNDPTSAGGFLLTVKRRAGCTVGRPT